MPGFTESFRFYLLPTEDMTKEAMTSGMVVLDTNVLLSAYRFAPGARSELLSVLDGISHRIWIPNRVAEEFHRNRLQVISDYDAAYRPVMEALHSVQQSLNEEFGLTVAQLANRVALSDDERSKLLQPIEASITMAISVVEELRKAHGPIDMQGRDEILERFQQLFNDRTGPALEKEDFDKAILDAEQRTKNRIPPGYMDAKNPEPYGDYLVWRQTLSEVKNRPTPYLVFVTGDNKEDWYQIIKGKTVGARPELVRELMHEANTQLIMMNTTSFLFHAREHLNFQVSQETIRQSETLPPRVSDKLQRQVQRRYRRPTGVEKLARRISSRRTFISTLERLIEERMRDDPEDVLGEIRVIRNQLQDARRSETILTRRLQSLQDAQLIDSGASGNQDGLEGAEVRLRSAIQAFEIEASIIRDQIETLMHDGSDADSNQIVALRHKLKGLEDRREGFEMALDDLQDE